MRLEAFQQGSFLTLVFLFIKVFMTTSKNGHLTDERQQP
jgi:hypothetical protein